jgi:hypothetical protein
MVKRQSRGNVFDRVVRIGLTLSDVEEGTSYGAPSLHVGGAMFACIPTNKAAEADSIVVRMSFTERDLRLAAEPGAYYVKPHYEGSPCVLARVRELSDDALADLLETGWQFVRSTKRAAKRTKKPR